MTNIIGPDQMPGITSGERSGPSIFVQQYAIFFEDEVTHI